MILFLKRLRQFDEKIAERFSELHETYNAHQKISQNVAGIFFLFFFRRLRHFDKKIAI